MTPKIFTLFDTIFVNNRIIQLLVTNRSLINYLSICLSIYLSIHLSIHGEKHNDFNRLTDSSTILVNQFNNLTRDFKTKCSLTDANQALMTEPS